ncbi:RNA polymerase sigma factor [Acetobacter orientalis]|uniref:DNA-directed RNA polymerase sigma-24/sigma-70 n=2 Tax=Acetobacter orientalis TaxID=146474 RepID=A0A2Z5ZK65_9PROT|nr:sigma-70 family RNA polymerase sigma factor [Acetobacter orientalis]BBC81010.1 DNA-directed RNA polymerase sigma-24/sigma-70 [Acetobacter orientalis]GAN64806.1 DNA-directed RNA polymerase sigma-24/sigma-70 [Acetobacter orientalis]GBR21527.1 RNA polymerase sigma-24 factor [Acetobacter orientalis NRIC 0481]GEL62161.1 hypothetical protein AOR02nite_20030 [Acetobacter orientalis]
MLASTERSHWLASYILPNEHIVRAWLARFPDFEADDIIQEAYVILSEADISRVSNPVGYFHTICRNLVLRHYKKAQIVNVTALADLQNDSLIDQTPSVEEIANARAELRFLEDAIQQLPEKCRSVFIDRKINGHSQKDCSKKLGISESSVEKRLARALVLISKLYGQREKDPQKAITGLARGNRRLS